MDLYVGSLSNPQEKQMTTTKEKWSTHSSNICKAEYIYIGAYRIGSLHSCSLSFFLLVHPPFFFLILFCAHAGYIFFSIPSLSLSSVAVEVLCDSTASPSSNHARNATWLGRNVAVLFFLSNLPTQQDRRSQDTNGRRGDVRKIPSSKEKISKKRRAVVSTRKNKGRRRPCFCRLLWRSSPFFFFYFFEFLLLRPNNWRPNY